MAPTGSLRKKRKFQWNLPYILAEYKFYKDQYLYILDSYLAITVYQARPGSRAPKNEHLRRLGFHACTGRLALRRGGPGGGPYLRGERPHRGVELSGD